MGVLLIDADHFKKVNDQHGHLVGDKVLRHIARSIREQVRVYDQVGRFGGEEFLVVLPGTNEHTAPVVAERVRGFIERHPLELPNQTLQATVSIGISTVTPANCLSTDEAIRRADIALYAAKDEGRNRSLSYLQITASAGALAARNLEAAR